MIACISSYYFYIFFIYFASKTLVVFYWLFFEIELDLVHVVLSH